MKQYYKSAVVYTGMSVLLAGMLVAGSHTALYQKRHNGQYFIPAQYSKIKLPAELKLVRKDWDDVHAYDPSLQSIWAYDYDVIPASGPDSVKTKLMATLKHSGYKVSQEMNNQTLTTYNVNASNGTLDLDIEIDSNRQYVEKVYISASLPVVD